jgi:hypothetical protein
LELSPTLQVFAPTAVNVDEPFSLYVHGIGGSKTPVYRWDKDGLEGVEISTEAAFANVVAKKEGLYEFRVRDEANGNIGASANVWVRPKGTAQIHLFGDGPARVGSSSTFQIQTMEATVPPRYEAQFSPTAMANLSWQGSLLNMEFFGAGSGVLTVTDMANGNIQQREHMVIKQRFDPVLHILSARVTSVGTIMDLGVMAENLSQLPQYQWSVSNPKLAELSGVGSRAVLKALARGRVVLTLHDLVNGLSAHRELSILDRSSSNQAPRVQLEASPIVGDSFTEFKFVATGEDPEALPLLYRFDFGADDIYETQWSASPLLSHRFGVGERAVQVQVMDLHGLKAEARVFVNVETPDATSLNQAILDLESKSDAQRAADPKSTLSQLISVAGSLDSSSQLKTVTSSLKGLTEQSSLDAASVDQALGVLELLTNDINGSGNEQATALDAIKGMAGSISDGAMAQRVMDTLSKLPPQPQNRGSFIDALASMGKMAVLPEETVALKSGNQLLTIKGGVTGAELSSDGVTVPGGLVNENYSLAVGIVDEVRNEDVIGKTVNIDLFGLDNNQALDTSAMAGIRLEMDIPAGANLENLRIAFWNVQESRYVEMATPDRVDLVQNKAFFTLKHLTEFALQDSVQQNGTGSIAEVNAQDIGTALAGVQTSGASGGGGGGCLLKD